MKISHVVISNCNTGYTDGWGYQENLLPEVQVRHGHDVSVIATTINSLDPTDESRKPNNVYFINGVRIIRIAPSYKLLVDKFSVFKNLSKVLSSIKPDVIFLHSLGFLSINELTKYKKLDSKCIIIADTHADEVNSLPHFKWLNEWILHKGLWRYGIQRNISTFEFIYYTCPQTKAFALEYYGIPNEKLRYLPMGGEVTKKQIEERDVIRDRWRIDNDISNDTFLVVTGGKLGEHKKLLELIDAFMEVDLPDVQLLIFGKFINKDYEIKVSKAINKDARIKFIGWLTPHEISELYLSADLGVFPGTQSIIWRNAIACGLPTICRYSFGAEEMDIGGNIIHLNSDMPFIWKQALEHVIKAPQLLDRLRLNSINKGMSFFDNERIATIVNDDILELVLQRKVES